MHTDTIFFTGSGADILKFDKSFIGQNFQKDKEGFFFTTCTAHDEVGVNVYEDPYSAGAYAKNAAMVTGGGAVVYPVYLKMENPLTLKDIIYMYYLDENEPFDSGHQQNFYDDHVDEILEIVKKNGHDSVMFDFNNEIFAVVFEPEQIEFALLKQ